jgi:hypothetical protein
MYCGSCGQELPDDANFCLRCGAPQQSESERSSLSGDVERELRQYVIDKKSTLVITNTRVIYDIRGFLGSRVEVPLRHITGVEKLGGIVRVRRTDGGSSKFNFGKQAEEIAQALRDIIAANGNPL